MYRKLLIKSIFGLIVLLSLMFLGNSVQAQISHGGKPWTFSTEKGGTTSFINVEYDEITLKAPDVEPLIAEDLANADKGNPPRVGTSIDADITMESAGTWTELPMGARLWTLKITVPGAKALTLGFEDFYLCEGSKLFFYNENRKQVLGSFTSENNLENRTFAIEPVQGENIYIEYYEPAFKKAGNKNKTTFRIFDVGYFYREFTDLKPYKDNPQTRVQESESCEVDVNCTPVGDDWQDEKRGVAQITLKSGGEWYVCTGSLINNTNSDGTPYFLTAFHCGEDNTTTAEFNQWIFKFRYEAPAASASGAGTTITSEPSTARSITGCTKKASGDIDGGSDMLLLLLSSTPTAAYEPYYNGWTRSTTAPSNGVGIHHPAGDIKKISTYTTSSQGTYNSAATNAHWKLQWRQNSNGYGVTEGGSSGSPLFDSNGYIVGTLTGGSSYCTLTSGQDYYGKFSYHWSSNGTTDATQLKPWLDPSNTNVTNCPGYDPYATQPPEPDFAASRTTILEGESIDFYNYTENNPVSYSWSFPGGTPSSSTDAEPTGITYNTAGTYNVSLSSTNANGTNSVTKNGYITVVNAEGTFCDTVSQFGGSLANYYFGDDNDNVTGYVGGTNNYDMTAWAEKFSVITPYNKVTGFRFFPAVAKNATNSSVTFKVWSLSSDLPDEVLASKTITMANVVSAMNSNGYIDIEFDNAVDIPADGIAIGFERPGTPASGDTLASYTNAKDGEAMTACVYYNSNWYLYSSLMSVENLQYPMLPFVCYDGSMAPTANFTSDTRQVEIGGSVTFADISSGNVASRSWTFEGGTPSTSTDANPVVTYSATGSYQVSLTVTNANGSNTKTVDAYIDVYDPNSTNAFSLDFEACANFQVDNFDPWTTYDGDGYATYSASGLTYDNAGYTGSFMAFNASATDPAAGDSWAAHGGSRCGICFAATTAPNNDYLMSTAITLGNNSSFSFWAKSITDTYGLERFNVLLSTTNNTYSSFTTKLSGNSYIEAPTTWTQYTYDLSAYDGQTIWVAIQCVSNDAFAFMIDDILISSEYSEPEADFTADNTTVEAGATVNFTDQSTQMPTSWAWTFDGGTPATSTVQNPSVVYETPGTYSVSLTVTNAQGTDTETKTGYITVTRASEVIVEWNFPTTSADATADAGIEANLTKTISVVGAGGQNGGTITYTANGETTKCARANYWKNGSGSKYWTVNFTTSGYENIKFWSKQSASGNTGPKNFKVQYSLNNSTWTDVTGATVTCATNWTTGVLEEISLPEACNNQATVYLRWIMSSNSAISGNMSNNTYSYIDDIVVKGVYMAAAPEAEFTADATSVCPGTTVTFTDQTTNNPTSWSWDFGDGGTSTAQNPTHTYETAGTYTVTLVAGNANGTDTEAKTNYITVNAAPTVTASNDGPSCVGGTAALSANVSGASTYAWSGPNSYTASTQNATIENLTANHAGIYTITATSAASCTATASTTLTVNAAPSLTVSNNGPYCEDATISLNANGNGGTSYSWSGPDGFSSTTQNPTIANATTDKAGTYTATLTNTTTGCSTTATTDVVVNELPTLSPSNNGPYCVGETITLNANGSGGTYAWSGPNSYTSNATNPTIANAAAANAGTYNVTLTNATTGCSAEANTVVVVNANPTVSASNTGAYCAGQTISLSATSNATSFAWSGPNGYTSAEQNPTIANIVTANGGTYTVIATNANNCTAQASTVVTVNANPTANASNTGAYCEGQTITLQTTSTGTYAWSGPNGFTSNLQNPTIANSAASNAGAYTLVVTNANNCSATASTDVVVNATPTVTASNTGAYCAGQTISLSAVSNATAFAWSGPSGFTSTEQNPTIDNVATTNSGNYTVVATNASGCTAEALTSVVVNANPTATASNTGAYCEGQTIALQTTATGTYAWSGPNGFTSTQQNPTIANAAISDAGEYTLAITDANGCIAQTSTVVVVNANPVVELGSNITICPGETTVLDAGAGYTYQWSTSANTQTVTATAGDYYVTVFNANECSATDNISVTNYPQTTLVTTSTAESHNNALDGTAAVTATGTSPFQYSWSNNGTTATISGLAGGNYNVTVIDGNGCESTAMVNVATSNTPPVADFSANNTTVCLGAEISFTDLSTNTPTSWTWNFGDGETSNVQNPTHTYATVGSYTVSLTVANADGSNSKNVADYIIVNANPTVNASNSGPYCVGETIELLAESDGNEYQWSGPMGFSSALQNPTRANSTTNYAGAYNVVVTSANGCTVSASTTVVVNANPVASIVNNSGTTTITCGMSSIELVANGGTSYLWDNGAANTAEYNVTEAGTHTVVVTNEYNCTDEASIIITSDGDYPVVGIEGNLTYCEGGTISLTATSDVPATYTWVGPNGFTSSSASISLPNATTSYNGAFVVTAMPANGCAVNAAANVVINANPEVVISSNSPVCAGEAVTFTTSSSDALTYSWSGPNGFSSTLASPTIANATVSDAGTYELVVENQATGCVNTFHTELIVNANPVVDLGNDIAVCANVPATIIATAGFVSYTWNGVAGSQTYTTTDDGVYTVVVADNHGCTASDMVTVSHYELPVLAFASTTETGTGQADGTAEVTISGGVEPYAILWNTNATTAQLTGLTTGQYSVVVTDNNGCEASGSVNVGLTNTPPVAAFEASATSGCAPLTVNFTDASTNYPQSWTWYFGETTSNEQNPTFEFAEPGTYTVMLMVSNPDGTNVATSVIRVYANPTINLGDDLTACVGSAVTVNAAAGFAAYAWSNGATESTIEVTEAGSYSVVVTDDHGCTATDDVAVTFNQLPVIELGDDVNVCSNASAEINAGEGFASYAWSTGDATQSIMVSEAGEYTVTVTDEFGCTASDAVNVTVLQAPTISLDDVTACTNQEVMLSIETDDFVLWLDEVEGNIYTETYPYAGEYQVWVTVSNEYCETTDTVTVTVELCNGVEEMSVMEIQLYPNPVRDIATFTVSGYEGNVSYSVVDLSGREMTFETVSVAGEAVHTVDVSNFVPGMYILRVTTGTEVHNLKFTKE